MRITKTGIELPEGDDYAGTVQNALGTLWKIVNRMADVIDRQQDEIDELKQIIKQGDLNERGR